MLSRIRLGDAGIVLVAPEQLRNRSFRKAIAGRRIGAWVVDEAHCLSKWGHDFRPDYRYVARYIAEHHGEDSAPILCLTATAKANVIEDIREHFDQTLQSRLEVIDGGAERSNLEFVVMPTSASQRLEHIQQALEDALRREESGGAIVYCTTKRSTEETAQALADRGLTAQHFHSGLSPERKREIQRGFHDGDIDVVVATNAFGMGIDKPDVRAVVHAEIPGSPESYLQEAGRAGRDGAYAHCLLLFETDDSEQQFSLTARSRLERRDIQAVLRAIRRLDQRRRRHPADTEDAVVATTGEILLEDDDGDFARDSVTDDDRVRTAIAWLEESKLARRDENHTSVFPSSLRVSSLAAARERIEREGTRRNIRGDVRAQMLRVVQTLTHANPDTGVSTDELMNECGCSLQQLRKVFSTLEEIGVASNDMRITVYVHTPADARWYAPPLDCTRGEAVEPDDAGAVAGDKGARAALCFVQPRLVLQPSVEARHSGVEAGDIMATLASRPTTRTSTPSAPGSLRPAPSASSPTSSRASASSAPASSSSSITPDR